MCGSARPRLASRASRQSQQQQTRRRTAVVAHHIRIHDGAHVPHAVLERLPGRLIAQVGHIDALACGPYATLAPSSSQPLFQCSCGTRLFALFRQQQLALPQQAPPRPPLGHPGRPSCYRPMAGFSSAILHKLTGLPYAGFAVRLGHWPSHAPGKAICEIRNQATAQRGRSNVFLSV